MRRTTFSVLLLLLVSHAAFAGVIEPGDSLRPQRLGRAMIVHPTQPLTEGDRAELAAKGLVIRQPLSGGRYLARLTSDVSVSDARIEALEPLSRIDKLQRSLLKEVGRGKTWMRVNVVFQDDVTYDDARNAILAAGGALKEPFDTDFAPSFRIAATIAPASLDALVADERVLTIGGVHKWGVRSDNAQTALLSHVTELYSAPYDLSGDGVIVSLFELGQAQASHKEFGGRMTNVNAAGGPASDKTHATHVAGTIAASGLNPDAKGMAPKARIFQFCVATPSNDCDNDWLKDKDRELSPLGVRVDNNSWGYVLTWDDSEEFPVWLDSEEYLGAYDLQVGAPLDSISIQKGILFVHSAGNDGNGTSFDDDFSAHRHVDNDGDTITTELFCYSKNGSGTDCPASCTGKSLVNTDEDRCEKAKHQPDLPYDTIGVTAGAKNIITVGAVITGNPPSVTGFSSRGPAKDGRVKPDVVARGFGVLSSIPTDAYGRLQGTSMASPAVTGIAALLVEQWRKTFAGQNPTPAQLKALIIAGATDLGNTGPDYTYGFGLVNAKNSADIIIADGARGDRIRSVNLSQGQTYEASILVPQQQDFRVVLNWADPAIPFLGGDDIAAKALVNDLDVKVIDPAGVEHRPYVLDKVAFTAAATRGVNTTDNVEMLEIPGAAAGTYRVVVTGSRVSQGPQAAVLVTSARTAGACADITEALGSNNTPETASGFLASGQTVSGAICTSGDVDYYSFNVTKAGPVSVTVNAHDTPLRVTLTGTGISGTVDVPANSTRTLTVNVTGVPVKPTLRIEAPGSLGGDPAYTFTAIYPQASGPRRRAAGH